VITAPAVQGRLAPAPSAAPTLRLEEGAAVRLLETAGDWNRVEAGGVTAWIPSSTFEKP
jgi:SH3-like domain-containing protein